MPVSSGEATGLARVLTSPVEVGELGQGYVLVCPSTDPSWTPLFAGAAALVLERGGILSHGAVVAREMGLPAVVLPEATRLFRDGDRLCVDGRRGLVERKAECENRDAACGLASALRSPPRHLPPPGQKDRVAARVRNVMAAIWTVFLLGFFLLPARWVYGPTLSATDCLLWPLVRTLGKPGAVAALAAALAVTVLLVQKFATGNRRLLAAKRWVKDRAKPQAAVTLRTLSAAMVPVGILLGPMVIPFVWFGQRVDPALASSPPGSAVQIVATVDGEWTAPVRIEVPPPLVVDETTPAAATLPPLRPTLERLLALYRQPHASPSDPWELSVAPDLGRQQTADDLEVYLAAGIPPQPLRWLIRSPEAVEGDPSPGGKHAITVSTADNSPLTAVVVLGDEYPPAPRSIRPGASSPIKELRVIYPPPKEEPVFWRPLAFLEGAASIPFASRLAAIHVGWLTLYIVAYVLTLLVARPSLRVA